MAKVDELDALGYECATSDGRQSYATLALGWRRTAVMARSQEAHPHAGLVGRD